MLRVAYRLQHTRCPLRTLKFCKACLRASRMAGPTIYPMCHSNWSGLLTDQIYYNHKTVLSKRSMRLQPLMRSNYHLSSSKSSPPRFRNSLTPSRTPKFSIGNICSRNKRGRPASGWRAFQIACGCPKGTHRSPTEYFRVPNDFICIYI